MQPGIHTPGPKWFNSKGNELPFPTLRAIAILICGIGIGRLSAAGVDLVVLGVLGIVCALAILVNSK